MKNEKGFTLVELIVVIAILGVILILALPQVQKIQSQNKTKKYETYQESLESAARLYMDNNARDLFGNNESGCVVVKYSELKTSNLIKDFGDSDVSCSDDATTYVEVRKTNNEYKYASAIKCVDTEGNTLYEDREIIDDGISCDHNPDTEVPDITVTPESSGWIKQSDLHIKVEITDPSGLNKNIGILYYWTDPEGNKVSKDYTYDYANKKGVTKINYTIPTEHVPSETGDFNLVIKSWSSNNSNGIQDVLGNERESVNTYGIYKLDNTHPTCGTTEGENSSWINQPFTITQHCIDNESGCTQESYQVPFNSPTKLGIITIKDNVGNTTDCEVDVYLDNQGPSCGAVSGDSTTWQNTDRNITVQCNDGEGSGCSQPSYTQYFSSEGATDVINISDITGNVTACSVNKYIDKTPPSISFEGRLATSTNTTTDDNFGFNNGWIVCHKYPQFMGLKYTAYDALSGVNRIERDHWYLYPSKSACGTTAKNPNDLMKFYSGGAPNSWYILHFLQCNAKVSGAGNTMTVQIYSRACDNAGNCSGVIAPQVAWDYNHVRKNLVNPTTSACAGRG